MLRPPSVENCVVGAMVVQNSIFSPKTSPQWRTALRPKADTTWKLHQQPSTCLVFFALLSQNTCIIGLITEAFRS